MENLTEFPPSIFAFFLFIIILLVVKQSKSNTPKTNLPPGPWKLPFIGNLHQLALAFGSRPPHRALRDMAKKYGPLMHLHFGEVSTIIVSSPETAKRVMKTHDIIFASRPNIIASQILSYNSTSLAFAPYGEYWRQVRKICTLELLSTKRVQSFKYIRQEETSVLMNLIANSNSKCNEGEKMINLTEKIYPAIYSIISRAAFGGKSKDQESFIQIMEKAIQLAAGFNVADIFPSVKLFHLISGVKGTLDRLQSQLDSILENIVDEHKKASYQKEEIFEDIVDVLLKYLDKDGNRGFYLSEDNIKAVILVHIINSLLSDCLIYIYNQFEITTFHIRTYFQEEVKHQQQP